MKAIIKVRVIYGSDAERDTAQRVIATIDSILEGKQKLLGIKRLPHATTSFNDVIVPKAEDPAKTLAIDFEIQK